MPANKTITRKKENATGVAFDEGRHPREWARKRTAARAGASTQGMPVGKTDGYTGEVADGPDGGRSAGLLLA